MTVERVVATLHPTIRGKGGLRPLAADDVDVNDTLQLDPASDEDVAAFFTRLPEAEYLPTWYDAHLAAPIRLSALPAQD